MEDSRKRRGRPSLGENKKYIFWTVRVTPELNEKIKKIAAVNGISPSLYLRKLAESL